VVRPVVFSSTGLDEPVVFHNSARGPFSATSAARLATVEREVGRVGARESVGRYGEDVAVAHLRACGLLVLERNWRCPQGEIDVVALDGECLVVCEVKTRRSVAAGGPLDAVTPAKLARLRRLAAAWLATQSRHFPDVRIDVIGVLRPPTGPARLQHLKGVC
jgi:putative endonuclease